MDLTRASELVIGREVSDDRCDSWVCTCPRNLFANLKNSSRKVQRDRLSCASAS